MKLKKVWIKGFRNLEELVIDFEGGENLFICGKNNQGKTNFLEGLYFLGHGNSPNLAPTEHLINFKHDQAFLGVEFEQEDNVNKLYFKLDKTGKKTATLNNKKLKTYSELDSYIIIDYLSADIIRLFTESPDVRRKDLDRFCIRFFSEYREVLGKYEKVVKHKNILLKEGREFKEVEIWNLQLVDLADQIVNYRRKALDRLSEVLNDIVQTYFPELFSEISFRYSCFKLDKEELTPKSYKTALNDKLKWNYYKEKSVGYSLYGPHRDDIFVYVDSLLLYDFLSRGMNRLFAILYRISQLKCLKKKTFLLLDDVLAELDGAVKKKLVSFVSKTGQYVMTTVLAEDQYLGDSVRVFDMDKGKLTAVGVEHV